ncbi:MAG: TPM domain-containing protein, partial [Candidatus Kryptonium sp.]
MKRFCLSLLFLFCFTFVFAGIEIPKLTQRVTDLAGILTAEQIKALEYKLAKFEDETTNQIAILIIPSLEGEDLEDFSIKVVEKNKLGQAGKDNGVLFLIAIQDRKMRLEVGYGLEGALPDALCDQILRNIVRPKFRQGDYYAGIDAGIDAIILATKGEFKADPRKKAETKVGTILALIIIGIVLLAFFGSMIASARHYSVHSKGHDSALLWLWLLGSMSERRRGGGYWGGWSSGGGFSGGGWSGGGGSFGGG